MTTKVTVTASGPCYPARLVKVSGGGEAENVLIASGFSYETWVGMDDTVTVTEEYHEHGYPPPAENGDAPETVDGTAPLS